MLNESRRVAQAVQRAFALASDQIEVHEVFVIDGASEDETVLNAKQAGATVLHSKPGRGIQLATGAREATGDVVLILHVDNWLDPTASDQMTRALKEGQVESGAFWQRIEAEGFGYRALEWGNAMRVRWFGLAYGDQAIFVRRSVLELVGGIPEVPLMEDVALMRLLKKRKHPVLLKGPLYISPRRWQQNGVVRQTLKNWFLLTAYSLGMPAERIVRWYEPPTDG